MEVHLEAEVDVPVEVLAGWERRLSEGMARLGLPEDTVLAVRIVDDRTIRELNAHHRNKDEATDVLSFPMYTEQEVVALREGHLPVEPGPLLLGDIVVSFETCRRQADSYGHGLDREFGFLLAHGLLHLTGLDHETSEDDLRMRAEQRRLLQSWGLEVPNS